ncbi:MAG: spermidine synthase [Hyphomicrobiaceae bacterium]
MQDDVQAGETAGNAPATTRGEAPHPVAPTGQGTVALIVYTATTFLSALLLFSVQPMFAKMVLPTLGGSPSVWAVALVFFQATLLAGYCYAHILNRVTRPLVGGIIHIVLTSIALLALPIAIPTGFGEPPPGDPAFWQLGLFAAGVGLPFLAVSANAPLLQAWFSASGHPHARDPYFLYGASNLGSLIALLAYPFVLEPAFGVSALSRIWTAGFVALLTLILLSVLVVRTSIQSTASASTEATPTPQDEPAPSLTRRLGWVGLAFVPSALLTAFTTHISMDVASAPLLWVLPLALYLLTFVLVFRDHAIALLPAACVVALGAGAFWPPIAKLLFGIEEISIEGQALAGAIGALLYIVVVKWIWRKPSMDGMRAVHIGALILALLALSQTEHEGWFITASTGVAVFFAATMVAHRTLYDTRPPAARLTEFYLLMSLGGVLGGLFSALLAPRLFSEIFEYPLLLALTLACQPGVFSLGQGRKRWEELLSLWIVIAAAILILIWVPKAVPQLPSVDSANLPGSAWWAAGLAEIYMSTRLMAIEWGSTAVTAALFGLIILLLWGHPGRQLVAALGMCGAIVLLPSGVRRADAQRSYFGVYRVYSSGQYNILTHGTTLHGAQRMRDEFGVAAPDPTPGTYYYPASPMAKSVEAARENVTAKGGTGRFGIIGLGAGSLACLAKDGERWRFFEIDPLMISIARNPTNFTYLDSCQPKPPDIALGDARLTLAKEPDGAFDLIIVDAFTSDAVPIHLMTAEAMALYLKKTSPNGVAVLHISNRYLDLDAVLGATVKLVDSAHGVLVSDDEADGGYGQTTSTIAVFAKSAEALAPFAALKGAKPLDAKGLRAWTDDYSDIVGPFFSKMKD